jgi:hypothetical protein
MKRAREQWRDRLWLQTVRRFDSFRDGDIAGANRDMQPVLSEWLKLTGPNLLAPKSQHKRCKIKQFSRLISA